MFSNSPVAASYPRSFAPGNGSNPTLAAAAAPGPQRTLFCLAITPQWIERLVLALVLVGHSSYRAVQEVLRIALAWPLSVGSIHNLVQQAAQRAETINRQRDQLLLGSIAVGAHDEIFQGRQPALVGVDVASSYCYLLAGVSHRDADSWSLHLLQLSEAGLSLHHSIADGGHALRLAQRRCWPTVACHGDVFHALYLLGRVCGSLERRALGAMQQAQDCRQKLDRCWKKSQVPRLSGQYQIGRQKEARAVELADDLRLLSKWIREDVLGLVGDDPATRRELYDWIVGQISQRASAGGRLVRQAAKLLAGQREALLAFVGELDRQLQLAAAASGLPLYLLRRVCELEKRDAGNWAYWRERGRLEHQLGGRFEAARRAAAEALAATHRCSSLVENLNSRLRSYFFLRRQVGRGEFLELLRFFLNHHVLGRSRCARRRGRSPAATLAGQGHGHWLEMLGYGSPQLN